MRIIDAELGEFGGRLGGEAAGPGRWKERGGLLLTLGDAEGGRGQGEASPLPGYSSDTLSDARRELSAIEWARLPSVDLDRAPLPQIEPVLGAAGLRSPSARLAVETALLDLVGGRLGLPLYRLLEQDASVVEDADARAVPVPLAALLAGDVLRHAARLVEEGYGCLKLKVGGDPDADLALLDSLRVEVGAAVALRADANRSLPAASAEEWLREAAGFELEFVEEPVAFERLLELTATHVPIALDESLHLPADQVRAPFRGAATEAAEEFAADRISEAADAGRCSFVVLKPMALGGLGRCMRLAATARARGAEVVVSHLFDGPVGLAAAAELALALRPTPAAGLAPHPGLGVWPAAVSPAFQGARLAVHDRPGLGLPPLAAAP
ncbi:MAG: enolase C-terminal domain-like protein [Gemmatimonadota bacterium]